ncbi:MAG: hypothetical protein KGO96_12300 [Elusimicrobia bacterium]|nr:hypothetical protein [Elusimicrobiota bacterium]MDE2426678.1 hypothetical protein [Elusimicrobiota bacterium]
MKRVILSLGCAALLGACAVTRPVTPTTLAAVEQSATLATQAADTYVVTAHPSAAQRAAIGKASDALHAAVVALEQTPAGVPLDLAAFNAALSALAAAGVPVAGASK